jgi:hypothetical protein
VILMGVESDTFYVIGVLNSISDCLDTVRESKLACRHQDTEVRTQNNIGN